jgi:hypothetical protein
MPSPIELLAGAAPAGAGAETGGSCSDIISPLDNGVFGYDVSKYIIFQE